ncbi:EpsG family protein [Pseudoalteromonas piscicida]|uniref:EpsG family protein n=1 Tax=Pseudoalteromonas piscicida TaxID=43662 RepID=A0A2A5JW47_PSEO7|nr:EpsG family protein [Pseudoalteromonas piscicida]PCK33630.1 hypothetical protein CEX98_01025 [Pseudoalteromonas piscicida]
MINITDNFISNILGVILVVLCCLHLFLYNRIKRGANLPIFLGIALVLLLFFGFRSIHSGVDTLAYYRYFQEVKLLSFNGKGFEPGFFYLTYFFAKLGNWHAFLGGIVLIQLIAVFVSSNLLKIKDTILPVMLYIALLPGFDLMTNGLRQGVALSLGMLMVVVSLHYRWVKPITLTSILMHKSMISYIVVVFLPKFLTTNKAQKYIVLAGVVVSLIGLAGTSLGVGLKFADLLPIPIPGTGHSLGAKIDMYLYIEKQLLSPFMKLYFLLLSYALLWPYLYSLLSGKDTSSLKELASITLLLQFIFLLVWWTNFGYRFMYISYIASIFLSVKTVEEIGSKKLQCYLYAIVFLGFLSTYGSQNFSSFSLTSALG